MNMLGDFSTRVNKLYPSDIDNEQLESLLTTINNQGDEIAIKDKEISRLQAKIEKMESARNTEKKAVPASKRVTRKNTTVTKKSSVSKPVDHNTDSK